MHGARYAMQSAHITHNVPPSLCPVEVIQLRMIRPPGDLTILITPSGKISLFLVTKFQPGFAILLPARNNCHEEAQ